MVTRRGSGEQVGGGGREGAADHSMSKGGVTPGGREMIGKARPARARTSSAAAPVPPSCPGEHALVRTRARCRDCGASAALRYACCVADAQARTEDAVERGLHPDLAGLHCYLGAAAAAGASRRSGVRICHEGVCRALACAAPPHRRRRHARRREELLPIATVATPVAAHVCLVHPWPILRGLCGVGAALSRSRAAVGSSCIRALAPGGHLAEERLLDRQATHGDLPHGPRANLSSVGTLPWRQS